MHRKATASLMSGLVLDIYILGNLMPLYYGLKQDSMMIESQEHVYNRNLNLTERNGSNKPTLIQITD